MKITHRIYEDGSRIRCEVLANINASLDMMERQFPPSPRCHVPWYTREGKTARFTLAALKRATVKRDSAGMIVGCEIPGYWPKAQTPPRITAKQIRMTLAELLAYLDGEHNDDSVIEKARQIAA